MTQVTSAHLGESLGTDFFSVREQFTDEQWSHFITVRRFVNEEVVPVVGAYWERAEICWPLVKRLPELGIVGEDIKGYGCAEMSPMACGLVTMELHRGDGSLGVFLGVHAGLAMESIAMCGSEDQKARWLPDLAQMNKLGAFALTEPEHGSDSIALETSARPVKGDGEAGGGWVLNGRKRWIGLGSVADLIVVWARNTEDGQVNGFVVEKGSPGYQARVIEGKVSLRSVWQAEITLENVRVPAENRLPGARSFKDTSRVLATTRSTCAWAALGHATSAYEAALRYAQERRQFGEQLASFQIIQQRLVSMLADLTAMQLYCLQIGRLAEAGRLTPTVAGLAKMHNTRKARTIAAEARDMLGGNGILAVAERLVPGVSAAAQGHLVRVPDFAAADNGPRLAAGPVRGHHRIPVIRVHPPVTGDGSMEETFTLSLIRPSTAKACARGTTSGPGFVTSDQWKNAPRGLRSAGDER